MQKIHFKLLKHLGIVPFMAMHLKGRFFVFFTTAFLLFLASAEGSHPAGLIA